MKNILLILIFLFSGNLIGQEKFKTTETSLESTATLAKGNELRAKVHEAWQLVKKKEYEKAILLTDKVLVLFNRLFIPSQKQFVFQSNSEYQDYIKKNGNKFQRIDWSYKEALQIKAFILASKRSFNKALVEIEKIERIAPVSATIKIEKGYVLGQVRKFELAYKSYLNAIAIADKYQSQLKYKPAALRGAGFILIELNQLNEAEQKLKKSLELEPRNATAINELKYIKHLREKKSKKNKIAE